MYPINWQWSQLISVSEEHHDSCQSCIIHNSLFIVHGGNFIKTSRVGVRASFCKHTIWLMNTFVWSLPWLCFELPLLLKSRTDYTLIMIIPCGLKDQTDMLTADCETLTQTKKRWHYQIIENKSDHFIHHLLEQTYWPHCEHVITDILLCTITWLLLSLQVYLCTLIPQNCSSFMPHRLQQWVSLILAQNEENQGVSVFVAFPHPQHFLRETQMHTHIHVHVFLQVQLALQTVLMCFKISKTCDVLLWLSRPAHALFIVDGTQWIAKGVTWYNGFQKTSQLCHDLLTTFWIKKVDKCMRIWELILGRNETGKPLQHTVLTDHPEESSAIISPSWKSCRYPISFLVGATGLGVEAGNSSHSNTIHCHFRGYSVCVCVQSHASQRIALLFHFAVVQCHCHLCKEWRSERCVMQLQTFKLLWSFRWNYTCYQKMQQGFLITATITPPIVSMSN